MERHSKEVILHRSARLALMALLQMANHQISTRELADVCGVHIRSIQRDVHEVAKVHIAMAALLNKQQEDLWKYNVKLES